MSREEHLISSGRVIESEDLSVKSSRNSSKYSLYRELLTYLKQKTEKKKGRKISKEITSL